MMLTKLRWQWSVVRRRKVQFLRWAWLRFTGKTAYRFTPLHITARTIDGTIEQANGWSVPYTGNNAETCDWRAALLEQIEKIEATERTEKAAKRKSRRS